MINNKWISEQIQSNFSSLPSCQMYCVCSCLLWSYAYRPWPRRSRPLPWWP